MVSRAVPPESPDSSRLVLFAPAPHRTPSGSPRCQLCSTHHRSGLGSIHTRCLTYPMPRTCYDRRKTHPQGLLCRPSYLHCTVLLLYTENPKDMAIHHCFERPSPTPPQLVAEPPATQHIHKHHARIHSRPGASLPLVERFRVANVSALYILCIAQIHGIPD